MYSVPPVTVSRVYLVSRLAANLPHGSPQLRALSSHTLAGQVSGM